MLKRRTPKQRLPQISSRALELFDQMQHRRRGSARWYDLHNELHAELQCSPWQWPLDSVNGAEIWDALEEAVEEAELHRRPEPAPVPS
jgi:hypothetical protein